MKRNRIIPSLLIFVMATVLQAQVYVSKGAHVSSSGSVTSQDPKGVSYTVELVGNIIRSSDGSLENSMTQGVGQYILTQGNTTLLITSGKVVATAKAEIKISVNGGVKTFTIGQGTAFCDGLKKAGQEQIKPGSTVTVTSPWGKSVALSVRVGPMLFSGLGGPLKLKVYGCR